MSLQEEIPSLSLNLTNYPRMRKKRPSFSPVKNARLATPNARGYSSNPSTLEKTADLSFIGSDALDTGLSSLQFEEFSWDDGKGGYKGVSAAHFGMLNTYMKTLYPEVITIEERTPYLVIWCDGSVPDSSKRPFLIAGLLGVWLVDGPDNLPREFTGESLGNLDELLELDDDLAEDIRKYHIPKTKTLCRLMHEHFPNALALSFFDHQVLVELPELPASEHAERLHELPGGFSNSEPNLFYHNGLRITGEEHNRLKQPMPKTVDGQCDDSDYVAAQGNFQPGSMICDDSGCAISAGILVEKGHERRLTVSIHCWQKELDEIPEKIGDARFFRVTQGKSHVGHITSRLGNTDIGLAALHDGIEFRNQFIDLPGGPTQLLHSDMLEMDSYFEIDSFTTGRQRVLCKGKRVISDDAKKERTDRFLTGKQKDLPDAGTYLVLVQGIFATSEPMANGEPIIRAGCCGSALVHLVKSTGPQDITSTLSRQGTASKEVTTKGTPCGGDSKPKTSISSSSRLRGKKLRQGYVNDGKIGGFMRWSNLQEKTTNTNTPRLFCYAEVADHLIDAGWEVVKAG